MPHQLPDLDHSLAATIYALSNAQARSWPFPHLVVDNVLHRELFEALKGLPLGGLVKSRQKALAEHVPDANPSRFFIQLLGGIEDQEITEPSLLALKTLFANEAISRLLKHLFHKQLEARFGVEIPATSAVLELIEDRTDYVLAPHTDSPQKLITMLVYLADTIDTPHLGTAIYMPRLGKSLVFNQPTSRHYRSEDMVEVARIDYVPNRALVFAPGANTFHGVPSLQDKALVRKLLQFQINLSEPQVGQ